MSGDKPLVAAYCSAINFPASKYPASGFYLHCRLDNINFLFYTNFIGISSALPTIGFESVIVMKNVKVKINSRKNQNGFTLIEVIVILVILAILAAILVPALTGYIDKANEKLAVAEARSVVVASQTIGSELYAQKVILNGENPAQFSKTEAMSLAEIDSSEGAEISTVTFRKNKVSHMLYQSTIGITVVYDGKTFSVSD